MFRKRRDNLSCRAMTLLEMILAMSIVAVIFAALLPQFRVVLNSWATREGTAESLQNARVLIDHINRNLSKATKITAVSDSTTTSGYIEYEDADGDTFRYDVGGTNYVRFGEVGDVDDLAGPVSQFQFTCYSLDDLDTPITNVDYIRCVEYQTTVVNSSALGQDKSFTGWVFLQTNQTSATQGPIMWLKLDETSGTTATDSSGNGNDGTLTYMSGNEWTAGQIDGALELDGSNDYVNVGDAASLDITDAITVTAWIKPNASQSGYKRLIEKHYASSWYFGYSSGANGLSTYINGGQRALTSTGILTVGEWKHVAFTYDKDAGGTDEVKIYLNGAVRATGNYSSAIGTDNRDIAIGRYKYGSGYAFNGSIDDVRIYNSARSAEDVAIILAGGTLTHTPSQTATDSSANGNDATLGTTDQSDDRDPSWVAGVVGTGSLSFDGEDDYAHTADSDTLLLLSGDYSISVWIKADASQEQWAGIYAKTNSGGTKNHWTLQFNDSGSRKIVVRHDGNNSWDTKMKLSDIAGDWHKVQISRTGATMSAYLDGVLIESGTFNYDPTSDPGHLNIGAGRTASNVFKGQIDDLRIYDLPEDTVSGGILP